MYYNMKITRVKYLNLDYNYIVDKLCKYAHFIRGRQNKHFFGKLVCMIQ
jgi:hypothetical protein